MEAEVVTLRTLVYSRAELLKSQLEASGIECFLSSVNVIRSTIATGVKVKVKEDDVEEALRIALLFDEVHGEEEFDAEDVVEDISRILVPVDFTISARSACEYAVGIADKLGAEVVLLHSYYFDIMPLVNFAEPYTYQVSSDKTLSQVKSQAEEDMITFYKEVREMAKEKGYGRTKIRYYITHGLPEDEILAYCQEHKTGAIIMGRKKTEVENNGGLFGDLTTTILENAIIPVLVIPEKTVFRGVGKTNILYATNFDDLDFTAIRKLMRLVYLFDVTIYCVHVGHKKWDSVLLDKLKSHIETHYRGYDFKCVLIDNEDVLTGLQSFIKQRSIDIMAMTTHKRDFIERIFKPSLTKRMLNNTERPMLVFHA
jgi:nucleotide-binding universal stress UspA family protein